MDKIEALADAIAVMNDAFNPDSEAYQLRNPGMLKAFALTKPQAQNEEGVRIFEKFVGGYRALTNDIETKVSGRSRSKLKPTNALTDLLGAYGMSKDMAVYVVEFLKKALKDDKISEKTELKFFTE